MAEPHTPARRKRPPAAIAMLVGAMLMLVFAGLFLARPASAATTHPAATTDPAAITHSAATTHPATGAAATSTSQGQSATSAHQANQPTAPDAGPCSVPGIGDIGQLGGFCGAGSGVQGDLNNVCTPSISQPEQASTGVDSMIAPPSGTTSGTSGSGGKTLYDNYGIAGMFWAAYGLQCSDMTSLIGNNVAGMVFDAAKSLDRVTISVYQSAAGNGILAWLQNAVNNIISSLGRAIFFPFIAPVVIIAALWLAWEGLFRKRATRTFEGTMWMVVACAAALWLIGRPADFTGVGANVSNGVTQILNGAFSKLPAPESDCVPVRSGDRQSQAPGASSTSASGLVDQNANELWSVLVCKPWLAGELGSTEYAASPTGKQTVVNQYGRQLLWAQAIAVNEQPTQQVITAKQDTYVGIAKSLQNKDPSVYPLFQGKQWTSRMEIGFSALFAAIAAGLLVLLISLTLIVLKLGWLLLLIVGPLFLLIGLHPGFGRVVAMRWFEMLVGVLLKQVAIALVLSVLLYCYSLIMGTADAVLPWALKILMIALVTVAVWIYRKPFTHLFSSVGYGMIGSSERAEQSYREGATGFRRVTATAAGVAGSALPGVGAYRAARWARRQQAAGATPTTDGAADAAGAGQAGQGFGGEPAPDSGGRSRNRLRPDGTMAPHDPAGGGNSGGSAAGGAIGRSRQWPEPGGSGRSAPPLPLPGGGNSGSSGGRSGGSGGGTFSAPPRPGSPRPGGSPASAARPRSTGAGNLGAGRDARNAPPPPTRDRGSGWPGGVTPPRSGEKGTPGGGRPSPARFWQRRTK